MRMSSTGRVSPTRRGRLMMRWADAILEHADTIGRLEAMQNGKLLNELVLQARLAEVNLKPRPLRRLLSYTRCAQVMQQGKPFEQKTTLFG